MNNNKLKVEVELINGESIKGIIHTNSKAWLDTIAKSDSEFTHIVLHQNEEIRHIKFADVDNVMVLS